MEKIMQSQTLSDASRQAYMRGKRILEINPRHPIIKELQESVVKNAEDESVKQTTRLICEFALVEGVSNFPDPKDCASPLLQFSEVYPKHQRAFSKRLLVQSFCLLITKFGILVIINSDLEYALNSTF